MATMTDITAATSRPASTGFNTADDILTDQALVDPHVVYYFDSVMPMQYVFGAEAARGVLRNVSDVPESVRVELLTCPP